MSTVTEDPRKYTINHIFSVSMYAWCLPRSLVAFGPKQRLMGHSAKNQHVLNFKNTIYGFRDLLGRKFSDPYVQQEMKFLPFTILQQANDAIGIKVRHGKSSL